jgi:hypothetical protein
LHLGWSQFAIEEYKVHAATQGKSLPVTIFFRTAPAANAGAALFSNANAGFLPPAAGFLLIFAASHAPC